MAARPAAVGGFVLGALVLAVGAILFFGGTHLFQPTTNAVIYFEGSVAGLDIGAPVTFRGVRVGSVQSMTLHLSPQGSARIPVIVKLQPGAVIMDRRTAERTPQQQEPRLKELVAAGLRAQLNLQSFVTGQLRVDLDFRPGEPTEPVPLEDTSGLPQIPALPSDLDRLRRTLTEIPLQDLAQTALRALAAIDRLADHVNEKVDPLATGAQGTLDSARRTLDTAGQAVAKLQAEASQTLASVDGLATDTHRQLDQRSAEISRVLETADRAGHQAQALLATVDGLMSPRLELRDNLEAVLRDLAATTSSLRGFAQAIERNPNSVLLGRSAR